MSFETESDVKGSNVKIVDDECILTSYISKYPQHLKTEITLEKLSLKFSAREINGY